MGSIYGKDKKAHPDFGEYPEIPVDEVVVGEVSHLDEEIENLAKNLKSEATDNATNRSPVSGTADPAVNHLASELAKSYGGAAVETKQNEK